VHAFDDRENAFVRISDDITVRIEVRAVGCRAGTFVHGHAERLRDIGMCRQTFEARQDRAIAIVVQRWRQWRVH
jgi:alpha/beta superfamily hydrolase